MEFAIEQDDVKNLEGYTILRVLVAQLLKFQHLYHMLHHEHNPKLYSIQHYLFNCASV
jgi:hypothetical protein